MKQGGVGACVKAGIDQTAGAGGDEHLFGCLDERSLNGSDAMSGLGAAETWCTAASKMA